MNAEEIQSWITEAMGTISSATGWVVVGEYDHLYPFFSLRGLSDVMGW